MDLRRKQIEDFIISLKNDYRARHLVSTADPLHTRPSVSDVLTSSSLDRWQGPDALLDGENIDSGNCVHWHHHGNDDGIRLIRIRYYENY